MHNLNRILEKATLILRTGYALHKPTSIQVEPTNRCNLKCLHCARKTLDNNKGIGNLNKTTFSALLTQIPELECVALYGLGEPFTNSQFFDMVDELKSKGIYVHVTSNATIISESVAEKLISKRVDHLNVSLDGATKETYESIRIGANFNDVVKNVEQLAHIRKSRKSKIPRLSISMVLTKNNLGELVNLIRLGKKIDIDDIRIQDLNPIWGTKELEIENSGILSEKILEAVSLAKELNIRFSYIFAHYEMNSFKKMGVKKCTYLFLTYIFDFILRGKLKFKPLSNCLYPWHKPYVTWESYVTPCCMLPDKKTINFGNIHDKSFKKIWNGKQYRYFRKMCAIGKYPDVCKDCILKKELIRVHS